MRYLLLTPDFPPAAGGVQTLMATLAAALAERHDVRVVTPRLPGDRAFDAGAPYAVRRSWGRRGAASAAGLATAALAAAAGADVVFCGHVAAGPAAWLCRAARGKPYVVYVHALEITPRRRRAFYRFLCKHAAGVITGSEYGRLLTADYLAVPAAVTAVVKPAAAAAILTAAGDEGGAVRREPARRKVLLTVGRLSSAEGYKGHDVVMRALALARARDPAICYWVVGGGDDLPRLRRLAAECGVADNVRFWGEVGDVAPFYRGCDVFIMPARRVLEGDREKAEGFGLVYLEAAAFGKPVIAGACAGARDAVVDGLTGILVDPDDAAAVASAIVGLFAHPSFTARLGQAGRRRVFEEFTPAAYAARMNDAVAAFLGRRD